MSWDITSDIYMSGYGSAVPLDNQELPASPIRVGVNNRPPLPGPENVEFSFDLGEIFVAGGEGGFAI